MKNSKELPRKDSGTKTFLPSKLDDKVLDIDFSISWIDD